MKLVLTRAVIVGLSIVATAGSVEAQSMFATRGLGFPMQPQDARYRALGGIGLGLPGAEISWGNPAATVGLPAPGLLFSYQYDNFSSDQAAGTFDGKTARFPLLLAGFPIGEEIAVQVGFGSFLDQNWLIQERDTLFLEPDSVPITDWSQSTGGVTRLRVGGGWAPLDELALGLGVDVYTGGVERLVGRAFPGEPRPACCLATWDYSGAGLIAGVHWSPSADSGVGLSLTYGGTLQAEPQDSIGEAREWNLPLTARAGASGRIGSNTLVVIGGTWSGWSELDEDLAAEGGAQNTWSAHAGIEWDGLTINERPIPLRVGGRTAGLPFRWVSDGEAGWARERAVSLGMGLDLAGGAARTDAFAEFGSRGGDDVGVDESFWRAGFSIRVLGR